MAEHARAIKNEYAESPMIEHALEDHPNKPRDFKMEVLSFPKTTLMRQATEAWEIRKHGRNSKVINRRGEWGQNLPPRLTVEDSDSQSTKRKARPQPPNPTGSTDRASEDSQSRKRSRREPEDVRSSSNNMEENRSQMETSTREDSEKAVGADPKISQYPQRQRPISFHFKTTVTANDPPNYPPADKKLSNTEGSRDKSGRKGEIRVQKSEVRLEDQPRARLYREDKRSTQPLSSATCKQEEISRESEEEL